MREILETWYSIIDSKISGFDTYTKYKYNNQIPWLLEVDMDWYAKIRYAIYCSRNIQDSIMGWYTKILQAICSICDI